MRDPEKGFLSLGVYMGSPPLQNLVPVLEVPRLRSQPFLKKSSCTIQQPAPRICPASYELRSNSQGGLSAGLWSHFGHGHLPGLGPNHDYQRTLAAGYSNLSLNSFSQNDSNNQHVTMNIAHEDDDDAAADDDDDDIVVDDDAVLLL